MELLFIGLTLGCLAFLVKIIMDYTREVPEWTEKTRLAEASRDHHESQMEGHAAAKAGSAEQAKSISQEIKTLESLRDELKVDIDKVKKDMARKGKIIMNRQNLDS
jgi:hypothetical protein